MTRQNFATTQRKCQRLAKKSPQDKLIWLELANAWVAYAEAAERRAKAIKKSC
jgi:hypothetical protein